jgi:hypothetical protein
LVCLRNTIALSEIEALSAESDGDPVVICLTAGSGVNSRDHGAGRRCSLV